MPIDRKHGLAINDQIERLRQKYPEMSAAFGLVQSNANDIWRQLSDLIERLENQAAGDLTNGTTGTGAIVLQTSPTIVTPTLTVPVIADFTSAQHNHEDADDGGTLSAAAIASGTLAIARGGTGQVTAAAAFDALAPTTTRGDLITRGVSVNGRLAVGASGRFIRSDGTDPSWVQVADSDLSVTDVTTNNVSAGAHGFQAKLLNCLAYNSGSQSVNDVTDTVLTFDSESFDNGGLHSTSSNTSRITYPVACLALLIGQVEFNLNTVGRRRIEIFLNGTTVIATVNLPTAGAGSWRAQVACLYQCAANDYFELRGFQDSGGALGVAAGVGNTFFSSVRVG